MTSTEVECFLESAYKHSFTKAGESLHIAPQAVSKNVHNLETALNTSLLVRKNKSLELTDAGWYYFSLLSSAISSLRQILLECHMHDDIAKNLIHIGISEWLVPHLPLMNGLKELRKQFPTLRTELTVLPNDALIDATLNNQLDLAFVSSRLCEEFRGLKLCELYSEDVRLLAPAALVPKCPTQEDIQNCFSLPLLLPSPTRSNFFERLPNRTQKAARGDFPSAQSIINCNSPTSMAIEMAFPRYAAIVDFSSGQWTRFERLYRSFPLQSRSSLLCIWSTINRSSHLESLIDFLAGFFQTYSPH